MRQDPNDDLEGHEPDNQQERDCQVPAVRVRAHAVRAADGAMVVTGVIVTMRAGISMLIRVEI